jgi:hypothetical protein
MKLIQANERRSESRKLPLQSFLARPTTRLGRYLIFLEAILSRSESNSDIEILSGVLEKIKRTLSRINSEAGKQDNILRLSVLAEKVKDSDDEIVAELDLSNPSRQIIREGVLKKKISTIREGSDLDVYLLDHCLLMIRKRFLENSVEYKVYKKPIPLALLQFVEPEPEDVSIKVSSPKKDISYSICFVHLGKNYCKYELYATNFAERKQWIENIERKADTLLSKKKCYTMTSMFGNDFYQCPNSFVFNNIVNNCVYQEDRIIFATEKGIYVGQEGDLSSFDKVLDIPNVYQLEIAFNSFLVLSEKTLLSFPLDILNSPETRAQNMTRAQKIATNVTLFSSGKINSLDILVVCKTKILNSSMRIFLFDQEPVKKFRHFSMSNLLRKEEDRMPYDENFKKSQEISLSFETKSIHFLKTKVCVGSSGGFTLVDVQSCRSQELLDISDKSLDFTKTTSTNPISLFRIAEDEILLCYSEFGIFVTRGNDRAFLIIEGQNSRPSNEGKKSRPHILWSGIPTSFCYDHPYIIAIDKNLIEIRNVTDLQICQIFSGSEIKGINLTKSNLTVGSIKVMFKNRNSSKSNRVSKLSLTGMSGSSSFLAIQPSKAESSLYISPTEGADTTIVEIYRLRKINQSLKEESIIREESRDVESI